ncbi:MAG: PIN domain-containing protein [Candidatus Aminicenantes bacterium]|nr:PIN domain-containing protein [Candidatus Aminicenantes bacterium]
MTAWFVDANVFLRFLTLDDRGQHEKAARLFESARRGECRLVTGPPVLFEVAWTLRAAYKVPKDRVLEALSAVFAMPEMSLTDAALVAAALSLAAATGAEFADAYVAASGRAAECTGVATFNRKDFQKLGVSLAEL